MDRIIERAALNNAVWCDAMCRGHGLKGVFAQSAWFCVEPMPRFYPNMITLSDTEPIAIHDQVRRLCDAKLIAITHETKVRQTCHHL